MTDVLATLAEASYGEITFPISNLSVEGGNDFAEHQAYQRRGVDLEPTGQKAYRGSFTIPCMNTPALIAKYGELFRGLREGIVSLFSDVPIGSLTLPGYDTFTAGITSWSNKLSPDQRGGTDLEVSFTEHNATAALLTGPAGNTPSNTPATVALKAAEADTRMASVAPSGWTPVGPVMATQLAALESAALPFTAVSECFRLMLSPIEANVNLPLFRPAAANGAVLALLALRTSVLDLRSRYQPTLSRVRLYTVPRTMALWEVAQNVYGDANQTALLRAANPIPDPLFVLRGTILTILPAG